MGPLEIRTGHAGDLPLVRALARATLSHLGDYARILPLWLARPEVRLHVAESTHGPVGFTMLAFDRAEALGDRGEPDLWIADLLAIVVHPAAQGRGAGRILLHHAVGEAARGPSPVREVRLSVALDNTGARCLFGRAGFVPVAGVGGRYAGGQPALRMRRRIDPPSLG